MFEDRIGFLASLGFEHMPPDDSGINPLSPGNGEELNSLGAKRLQGGRLF